MKKQIKRAAATVAAACMLVSGTSLTALAEVDFNMEEWNVSESGFSKIENLKQGREDARSSFFSFTDKTDAINSQQRGKDRDLTKALYQSLDSSAGQEWKFYYVSKPADRKNRPDNNHITESDYDDSSWDTITVPKSWEATWNENGTFRYNPPQYTNVTYVWSSQNPNPQKPNPPTQFNPVGFYRTKLAVDKSFIGKNLFITFEGVESAFYVWVNGHKVGFSEDTFKSKEFKIDEYLNYDGNDTLAVEVFKWSSGSWLEDQDMICLAGIFRSVYLTAKSDIELRDFTIVPKKTSNGVNPDADYNDFGLDVHASIRDLGVADKNASYSVSAEIYNEDGTKVPDDMLENANLTKTFTVADLKSEDSFGRKMQSFKLSAVVKNPKKWSAEHPNLYKALITVYNANGDIIETTAYRFGFRIIEINNKNTSNAQMLVNGMPLLIKGVNIHEMYSETGRYIPSDIIRKDVTLMKQNNFNAIRMSHYGHDFRYYDSADEIGLYVMEETNLETHGDRSIPASNPNYLPACLDRVSSMFYRSKNFPCVIMLSLGNEAGVGDNFRHMADWLKGNYSGSEDFYVDDTLKGDLQCRPIHYEGDNDKADIKSNMYPSIESIQGNANENKPYILCEFSHAMGNSNGNYQGYWDEFESKANIQGGFIWDWVDQSIKTYVKSGYAPSQIDGDDAVAPIVSLDKNKVKTTLSAGKTALLSSGVTEKSGDYALSGAATASSTPDALNINGSITLEAWIKPEDNGTDPRVIIAKGDLQYQVKTIRNTVHFNTVCGGWNTVEATYDPSNWAGKWHHIAAVYDAKTQNASVYIDDMSAPAATQKFALANDDGTYDKTQYDFGVGRDVQYSGSRDWKGLIDNVRVYSKALTAAELSDEGRKPSDENVEYWQDFNTQVSGSEPSEDAILSEGYYAYGGDWGDDPNDSNFCQNGVVGPDRVPHGAMLEIKRVHQDYVFSLDKFSDSNVKMNIRSRALFTNASDYDFVWQLKEDGKTIASGKDDVNIAPLATESVDIAFDKITPKAGKEYYITAKFLLKSDTQWAKAGHEISAGQFKLDFDSKKTEFEDIDAMPEVKTAETDSEYTVSSDDFTLRFDRQSGTIKSFVYKGKEIFAQDGSESGPAPNFWRAPTDNDRGSGNFQNSATVWRYAGSKRKNTVSSIEKLGKNTVKITFGGTLAPSKGSADYEISFTVYGSGEIVVDNTMTPSGFSAKDVLPAVGNLMQFSSDYENMTWFGRGSDTDGLLSESYSDKKNMQFVDVYSGKVSDQHTNYPKTQTSGNKMDIRWAAFTDDAGSGVLVSSIDSLFEINAQHVTPEELTTLNTKHLYEANPTKNVVVELNAKQIGVGFDPNWIDKGWYTADDIIRPIQTFKYNYKITPVSNFSADTANDISDRNLSVNPITAISVGDDQIADFDANVSEYAYYIDDADKIPTVSVKTAKDSVKCDIDQATSLKDDYTAVINAELFGVKKTYTVVFKKRFASVYLDDLKYTSGIAGGYSVKYNKSVKGNPLTVWKDGKNTVFEHGIGTHADSKIVYNVKDKGYSAFTAYVNLDQEAYKNGSDCPGVQFLVYADNKVKYSSPVIYKTRNGTPEESLYIKADIAGAKTVTLRVIAPSGSNQNAYSDWCDAKFESYANGTRLELIETLNGASDVDTSGYSEAAIKSFNEEIERLRSIAYDPTSDETALKSAMVGYNTAVEKLKNSNAQPDNPNTDIAVGKIALSASKFKLTVGKSKTIKATVSPSNASNKTVTWSSSDSRVATVSNSGKIVAKDVGTAVVTAKSGGKTASVTVTVNPKRPFKFAIKKQIGGKLKITVNKADRTYKTQVFVKFVKGKFKKVKSTALKAFTIGAKKVGAYTVKLRSVKKVKGKNYYSAFTSVKKVTVK